MARVADDERERRVHVLVHMLDAGLPVDAKTVGAMFSVKSPANARAWLKLARARRRERDIQRRLTRARAAAKVTHHRMEAA